MKIYSDAPVARTAQIIADVTALAAITVFVLLGFAVHSFVLTFAAFGRQLEDAGTGFRDTMSDAAETLGNVPLIGGGVRAPFDSASDAGTVLGDAGTQQQALVAQLALVLGLVVALIPIAILVRFWLVRRLAFARAATSARSLSRADGGLELLALSTLAATTTLDSAHWRAVLAIDNNPVQAWRRGDPLVIEGLANLALRKAGVRAATRKP